MLKELGYNANIFDEVTFFEGGSAKAYCETSCENCSQGCITGCPIGCQNPCILGCKISGFILPCVTYF